MTFTDNCCFNLDLKQTRKHELASMYRIARMSENAFRRAQWRQGLLGRTNLMLHLTMFARD